MARKFFFEDGSSLEVTIDIQEDGKMATTAAQILEEFLDEAFLDNPQLLLEEEEDFIDLDEEDLEELEEFDEDWDDEDLDDDWDDEDDLDDFDDE
jgi:hypothetical protein